MTGRSKHDLLINLWINTRHNFVIHWQLEILWIFLLRWWPIYMWLIWARLQNYTHIHILLNISILLIYYCRDAILPLRDLPRCFGLVSNFAYYWLAIVHALSARFPLQSQLITSLVWYHPVISRHRSNLMSHWSGGKRWARTSKEHT